jgi:type IV pilus assembly protein PilX
MSRVAHPIPHHPRSRSAGQRGMALVMVLIMMSIVFVIASVSSRVATLGERAARNDRDRQTALQAAEAALSDAEIDIMGPTSMGTRVACSAPCRRGTAAAPKPTPAASAAVCSRRRAPPRCCRRTGRFSRRLKPVPIGPTAFSASSPAAPPSAAAPSPTAQFATSTGGALPSRLPRYVIEKTSLSFRNRSATAGKPYDAYIVTAIGYGLRTETQVVLQAVISKPVATTN